MGLEVSHEQYREKNTVIGCKYSASGSPSGEDIDVACDKKKGCNLHRDTARTGCFRVQVTPREKGGTKRFDVIVHRPKTGLLRQSVRPTREQAHGESTRWSELYELKLNRKSNRKSNC